MDDLKNGVRRVHVHLGDDDKNDCMCMHACVCIIYIYIYICIYKYYIYIYMLPPPPASGICASSVCSSHVLCLGLLFALLNRNKTSEYCHQCSSQQHASTSTTTESCLLPFCFDIGKGIKPQSIAISVVLDSTHPPTTSSHYPGGTY